MDTAIRIDILPCRGALLLPNTLDYLRPHTLVPGDVRPRVIDTSQPYLQLSREVPAGLHPKHSGVLGPSPFALQVIVSRVRENKHRLILDGTWPDRLTRLHWTSDKAFG